MCCGVQAPLQPLTRALALQCRLPGSRPPRLALGVHPPPPQPPSPPEAPLRPGVSAPPAAHQPLRRAPLRPLPAAHPAGRRLRPPAHAGPGHRSGGVPGRTRLQADGAIDVPGGALWLQQRQQQQQQQQPLPHVLTALRWCDGLAGCWISEWTGLDGCQHSSSIGRCGCPGRQPVAQHPLCACTIVPWAALGHAQSSPTSRECGWEMCTTHCMPQPELAWGLYL
jgi:hypothetical protein